MNPAMTLPSSSSRPATSTNPADHSSPAPSAAIAEEHGRRTPKSCHRPRIKQLKAVSQLPSQPEAPPGAAHAGAQRPKRMNRSEREEAEKITQPCSECGRRFWSWKALFGHMRCHPDRPWRGIEPPPEFPRRGPELLSGRASSSEGGASDAEAEAAASLVLLKGEQGEGSSSDEPAPSLQAVGRFRCPSCGKAFDTPNGLGGHRAGHARSARDAATRKRKATEEVAHHRAVQLHKCGVCAMSFSSGQALGGHMSSHWKGECEPRVAAAEAASSSTSSAGGCRFDLNLPPADETQHGFFPSDFAIASELKLPADDGFAP